MASSRTSEAPLAPFTGEECEEARTLNESPEANADPHFLLLGRPGVGKSTFAGKITGGRVQGTSGPGSGTRSSPDSVAPGHWRHIKTEIVEEAVEATEQYNTGQRYYVHDTVGLGDDEVDLEEMKLEVNEVCEQNDSQCCVFLCLSWDDRITSNDTKIAFEVCSSLNKWEDVIFVITKCDLASQLASNVDEHDFRRQWREKIKEKLIKMRVNEEIANTIITKQIIFSGYPQLCSELLDAIENVCENGYKQGKTKYLSFGRALFISEVVRSMEQRRYSNNDDGSVTTIAETNENLDESLLSSGSHSQRPHTPSSQFSPLSSFSSIDSSYLSCRSAYYQPSSTRHRSSSSGVPRRRCHPRPRDTPVPDSAQPQTATAKDSNSGTVLKWIVGGLLSTAVGAGAGGLIGFFIGGGAGAIAGTCVGGFLTLGAVAVLFLIGKFKKLKKKLLTS